MAVNKNILVGPKAVIHLDSLIHNFKCIREYLGGKPIIAVVKANGYGHGAVECATALEKEGANFFAVFTIEEAIELRDAGIKSDILLFSRFQSGMINDALKYDLILNIPWPTDLDSLIEFGVKNDKWPRFHIKIETGMSRLGINLEEVDSTFRKLKENPLLNCEGIYSHYSTADEGDLSYANYQLNQFNEVLKKASENGLSFKLTHFSNSGTVLNLPESYFDIVRVGMLLYGAYPSDEVPTDLDLKPVMEFIGPIVNVRRVSAGTQVSYGGLYTTKKETNLAVIQTGFADGFPRPWYEHGYVMYKGAKYPIAGRVCMDQLMVDFGDTFPAEGDSVLFWGENEHGTITMEEISEVIKSTPYVLATGINGRTERIFVK